MKRRSLYGLTELACGALFIVLAIYAGVASSAIAGGSVAGFAVVAIVCGVTDFFFSYLHAPRIETITARVAGFAAIVLGILALTGIGPAGLAMNALIPVWFIVHSLARLSNSIFIRQTGGNIAYWTTAAAGIFGVVVGILMIVNPYTAGATLSYVMVGSLLLTGAGSVLTALSAVGQQDMYFGKTVRQ